MPVWVVSKVTNLSASIDVIDTNYCSKQLPKFQ